MAKFTVLLLYPDYLQENGDDTYQAWVESDTVQEAKEKAQFEAFYRSQAEEDLEGVDVTGSHDDFSVLAVYEGHHLVDVKARIDPPYRCKFCGERSYIHPRDQEMPPDYCHPADHGTPDYL